MNGDAAGDVRRSEDRFRELIEQTPDMIMVHRLGVIAYANPAFLRHFGFADEAQVIGRNVVDLAHPEDRARAARRIELGRTSPAALPRETFRHLYADGRVGWLEVVSIPIAFEGAPAVVTCSRDCTARLETERRLVEAELLASVGRVAAVVNHEINNPLAFLVLTHAALEEELTSLSAPGLPGDALVPEATIARMLDLVRQGSEGLARVTTIARDFKSLTRVGGDLVERLELHRIIPSVVRIAESAVRPGVALETSLDPVPPVKANGGRMGQVILNLLVNAAEALPDADGRRIRTSTRHAAGQVIVDVEDDGPGISDEIGTRVFEPFFTTKSTGTGLGLSICQSIVTSFGGTLELGRSEWGGARFRVSLPAA